jgi:hypothetical protein
MRKIRMPLMSAWDVLVNGPTYIADVNCTADRCHFCKSLFDNGRYCSAFDVRLVDGMRADECKKAEVEE